MKHISIPFSPHTANKNKKQSFVCLFVCLYLFADNESCSKHNLKIAVHSDEYGLTQCSCHQCNRGTLTFAPLPGVQGVHSLVSGDSPLHGKGSQNDEQQAGNFGVHNYLYCNRKQESKEKTNAQLRHGALTYFDHLQNITSKL